jgi:hypothetical protein
MDPERGGLGLTNIKSFLIAQQINWIKRTGISSRDNWRVKICNATFGNCYTVSESCFNRHQNPILHNLGYSWNYFLTKFYSLDSNINESYILNNPLITRSLNDSLLLDLQFLEKFSIQRPLYDRKIKI